MDQKQYQSKGTVSIDQAFQKAGQVSPHLENILKVVHLESSLIIELTKRRIALGLTQRDLAKRSGIKQPMIARIELGECSPRIDTLIQLALALDLEIIVQPHKKAHQINSMISLNTESKSV